jgi:MraZ protein
VVGPNPQHTDQGDGSLNLLGSHRHALDDKRRVAIPKSYREQVAREGASDEWVLCRQLGGDPCLALYPLDRFEAALQRLESMRTSGLGVGSKEVRAYLRMVRRSAERLRPDRQGRITLSEAQCRLAGVEKDVVFVGSGDHAELWSPLRLDGDDDEEDFRRLAGQLFG